MADDERSRRVVLTLVVVGVSALCLAPLCGHIDDVDAQTYLVVARNAATKGRWVDLTFLPSIWPRFREHLPFGFWPGAIAIRLAGESWVPLVYSAFSIAAALVIGQTATRLAGARGGIVAMLAFGTCEAVWHYAARLLLEPPLFVLTALSVHAWISGRWRLAGMSAGVGILVKGPFGLIPLCAIAAADMLRERTPRRAKELGLACGLAVLPLFVFLGQDVILRDGSWWAGYVHGQLLGSSWGARVDGVRDPLFAARVVVNRFWPGLPLVVLAAFRAFKDERVHRIALACLIGLLALSLPTRKWGNHAYVLFPLLSILAGVACDTYLQRVSWKGMARGASVFATVALTFAAMGFGSTVLPPPCDVSTSLRARLDGKNEVGVVGGDMGVIAELAAERGADARRADAPLMTLPVIAPNSFLTPPSDLREVARGRKWKLLVPSRVTEDSGSAHHD